MGGGAQSDITEAKAFAFNSWHPHTAPSLPEVIIEWRAKDASKDWAPPGVAKTQKQVQ